MLTAIFPFVCNVMMPGRMESISFMKDGNNQIIPLVAIQSPRDNFTGQNYPMNQLCKYTAPRCPSGFELLQVVVTNLTIEGPGKFQGARSQKCFDFVHLKLPLNENDQLNLLLKNGAILHDSSVIGSTKKLCGNQSIMILQIGSNPDFKPVKVKT